MVSGMVVFLSTYAGSDCWHAVQQCQLGLGPLQGHPKVQETFRRRMGYVEQNDIHSPNTTVQHSTDAELTCGARNMSGNTDVVHACMANHLEVPYRCGRRCFSRHRCGSLRTTWTSRPSTTSW